jgi:transposase
MANQLKMAEVQAILALVKRGWSFRRISRELGVHRETVSRYARVEAEKSKPAISTPGSSGRGSLCEPFRDSIIAKLDLGLSAQRIWQDLAAEERFDGGYQSVKRFCRRLRATSPVPFRRIETEPGQEIQIDFGKGAPILDPKGRRRRPHLFRMVLSYSRKAYSEVVWRQTTEEFIRCLENAFLHFGGVTRTLVIDNLRAAVSQADWYDPDLNPKIEEFCRHYGTAILPTKSYTPRHKGKIERGVDYAQENALKGRVFQNLEEQNRFLANWEERVADHRIHGTTRKQVLAQFELERPHLLALPAKRFPFFHEGRRKVHRDGHIAVQQSYYSVPPEYVSREVWVRWDSRLVRVINPRLETIAIHTRKEPGKFSTQQRHIPSKKISAVERGATYLLRRARSLGPHSARWAEAVLRDRGVQALRVIQGLLALSRKHRVFEIERACRIAREHQTYRLKSIRRLIQSSADEDQLDFLEEHPLIRDLREYGAFVADCIRSSPTTDGSAALASKEEA